MDKVKMVAFLLLVIGGINWGLVGLLDINLVTKIFGEGTNLAKLIYALVGLSALVSLPCCVKMLKGECSKK